MQQQRPSVQFYHSQIKQQRGQPWYYKWVAESLRWPQDRVNRFTHEYLEQELTARGFIIPDPPPSHPQQQESQPQPQPEQLQQQQQQQQEQQQNSSPEATVEIKPQSSAASTDSAKGSVPEKEEEKKHGRPQLTIQIYKHTQPPQHKPTTSSEAKSSLPSSSSSSSSSSLAVLQNAALDLKHQSQRLAPPLASESKAENDFKAILEEWYDSHILVHQEWYVTTSETCLQRLRAQAEIEAACQACPIDEFNLKAITHDFRRQKLEFLNLYEQTTTHLERLKTEQQVEETLPWEQWHNRQFISTECYNCVSEKKRLLTEFIQQLEGIQAKLKPFLSHATKIVSGKEG